MVPGPSAGSHACVSGCVGYLWGYRLHGTEKTTAPVSVLQSCDIGEALDACGNQITAPREVGSSEKLQHDI